MNIPSPIAVTGASGFIGSWIVKYLLEAGVEVHATVRDRKVTPKTAHLQEMQRSLPGKLELFEADLLEPSGFDAAFSGCRVVMHVASPFRLGKLKDPEAELVRPALEGTRNVLGAVERAKDVERVVLTSSVVAIHTDAKDHQPRALDESLWNDTASLSYQPYAYSKTLAEREAWKLAEGQSRFRLVTINPSFVIGPTLSQRVDATSTDLMMQFVDGRAKRGVPDMRLGVVDVRDVAQAHVLAASLPEAEGRHLVSHEVRSFPELAAQLRAHYGNRYPIPSSVIPKWLMYLAGPLQGFSWRYVHRSVGVELRIDNSKSRRALGLEYRPLDQTLIDCIDQMEKLQMIAPAKTGS